MNAKGWSRPAIWSGRLLQYIASLLLFFMMALTVVDTFMRKVFSSPIGSAFELTELSLTLVIFAGLPLITARRGHVQVELIEPFLSRAVRRAGDLVIDLVVTIALAVLCWQLWVKAAEQVGYGDTTSVLEISLGPVTYAMAVLSGIAALISFVNAILAATGASAEQAARMGSGGT
ncbi:TRAP transporter small permease [Marinibaculum pumilum]|uniref:TRAP transporter small permease protein n=1 Tax=Marinibaculum pumilum TaxID=1766165 RepID=A0ABV7L738_9PROT